MNRYMSYQYSNNHFTYSSPATSTSSSKNIPRTSANDLATIMTTSNKYQAPAATPRYKSNELPWSSSLASSSRYPVAATTPKSSANNYGNSTATGGIYSPPSTNRTVATRPNDRVTSTTISGRSLFDYSAPRTALNTPSSRIYDGRLRRTVTAKYTTTTTHNKHEPSSTANTSGSSRQLSSQQSTLAPSSKLDSWTSKSPSKSGGVSGYSTTGSNNSSGQTITSGFTKPFRSSSLKLRASYTSILDQLTNTTLAKLKLGGSTSSSRDSHKTATLKCHPPTLAIVPDDPEAEKKASQLIGGDKLEACIDLGASATNTLNSSKKCDPAKDAASPASSSSGLSSGGAQGVSPTSSSSCYSQSTGSPTSSNHHLQAVSMDHKSSYSSSNDDSANVSNESPESDLDEQDTLVSLSAKQIATCSSSNELDTAAAAPSSPEQVNLIKTKAILAELESFDDESTSKISYSMETSSTDNDDDDDEYDDDDESQDDTSPSPSGHSIIQSRLINESELILKPSHSHQGFSAAKLNPVYQAVDAATKSSGHPGQDSNSLYIDASK